VGWYDEVEGHVYCDVRGKMAAYLAHNVTISKIYAQCSVSGKCV